MEQFLILNLIFSSICIFKQKLKQLRTRKELELAIAQLPCECSKQLRKELEKLVQGMLSSGSCGGQGKGVRVDSKTPSLAALVSQMHRTRDRLALEPSLLKECEALHLALLILSSRRKSRG